MITIFNRKEVCLTYDVKRQSDVRDILHANGIDYTVQVRNRKSPSPLGAGSRARTGTFGENSALANEYKIFVHKDDYEKAMYFIAK